jgi:hypothetical protein
MFSYYIKRLLGKKIIHLPTFALTVRVRWCVVESKDDGCGIGTFQMNANYVLVLSDRLVFSGYRGGSGHGTRRFPPPTRA